MALKKLNRESRLDGGVRIGASQAEKLMANTPFPKEADLCDYVELNKEIFAKTCLGFEYFNHYREYPVLKKNQPMTPQPPRWLQEEAERLYPLGEHNPLAEGNSIYRAMAVVQQEAHINAVLGCLEKYAGAGWDAAHNRRYYEVASSLDLWQRPEIPPTKQQFIDKLKTEGV